MTVRRRRSYRFAMLALVAAVVVLVLLLRPGRRSRPALPEPGGEKPEYVLLSAWDAPSRKVGRVSVSALIAEATERHELRSALDWLVYETRRRYRVDEGKDVQVVWAYLMEDSLAPKSGWRAMAIWQARGLQEELRPSGIGGDAVKDGQTEYDFTNGIVSQDDGAGG